MLITEKRLTSVIQKKIFQGFHHHAIAMTGIDGLEEDPMVFTLKLGQESIGHVVIQMFWGQLHIKYVLICQEYRGQGFGRALLKHALEYGKKRNCRFAFLETMSFQAPDFYMKLGFKVELKRDGYDNGVSFYYLKKDL